jgi:Holliday junction resolvase RusA-like endonuclease
VSLDGPLDVAVHAYFAIPQSWPVWKKRAAVAGSVLHTIKPDADNIAKCVDAFNGLLWSDDSRIATLTVKKSYSTVPRVVVVVTPMVDALHSGSTLKNQTNGGAHGQ